MSVAARMRMTAATAPSPKRRPLSDLIDRERRRRSRRRRVWWALVLLVPLLGVAFWSVLRPKPPPLETRFRVQPVTMGDVVREVHATGHLQAVTTVEVGAEISGRIASVEVDYNDHVAAGQILARFDRRSLEAQVAQVNATLQASRAAVEQAKTDRQQAKRNLDRAQRLHAGNAISDADWESAVSAANVADQRVRAAEAQVGAQQSAFAVAKNNLDHGVIRSPIDGIVITRNVDPGQTVAAAFQTPVLFTVAADLRKMEVVAAVDEADVGELAVEQHAVFTVTAYSDRTFEGVVREVRNSPAIVQDVVTYGTVIEVDNPDFMLKPGMTATVRIRTAAVFRVLRVPNAALHFTPPGESIGTRAGAWQIENERLVRADMKTGITDGEVTEIAPGALSAGANVIVDYTPTGKSFYGLAR